MPAWDNVSLASPPNGPAYINSAMNAASTLGNLVNSGFNAYRQGQDFQYQQQQRNFFQDPNNQQLLSQFMQQPNQQNYGQLMQKMAQVGGLQTAGPLIDQYLGISQDQAIANRIGGGNNGPPNPTAPQAGNPAQIVPNYGRQQGAPQPSPYNTREQVLAGDNGGGSSIDQLAAERHIDLHDFIAANPWATKFVGNDNLSLGEQNRLTGAMKRYIGGGNSNPVQPSGTDEQDVGKSTAKLAVSNELKPSSVQGGPPISPAPTTGSGKIRSAAPPPSAIANDGLEDRRNAKTAFDDRFNASYGNQGTRPSPLGDMAKVDALNTRIQKLRADEAAFARRSPAASQAAGKAADDLVKERDKILESISKFNEPGRTTREDPAALQRAENIRNDTERFGNQYDAYQQRADQARELLSTNSVTKSIMNSPGFYSGAGADHILSLQRLGVALGLAPKDYAMANEVFGKTVSTAIMNQIKSLQGLGQIRVAEINIMKQAAENHDNSPSSNRTLAEMQDRLAKNWTIPISEAAQRYNGGHLNAGFDRIKADIMRKPLFTPDELEDPRRIAPIEVRSPAELKSYGWRDGEPFRDANTGRIFTHLPKGAAPPAPVNPANQT